MANAILFKVEYVSREFDLSVPRKAFEFIFQMYNFFSAAKKGNDHLLRPLDQLADAKQSVNEKNYPTFSKRKKQEDNNETKAAKKSKPNPDASAQGGQEDSFGNPSVQREVTRAGYTPTRPIPKEFTPLTPVSRNSHRCAGCLV